MRNRFTEEPEDVKTLFGDELKSGLDKYSKKDDSVSLKSFGGIVLFLIVAVIAFWLFSQYYFVPQELITE